MLRVILRLENFYEMESKYEEKGDYKMCVDQEFIPGNRVSEDDLVDNVQSFFYNNEKFASDLESFVDKSCDIVDLSLSEDESLLQYTDLYEEFQRLFETGLEQYIISLGATPLQFYEIIRRRTDERPCSGPALFGRIVLACSDYSIFLNTIRTQKELQMTRLGK